jgi:adenylate cyclase
MNNMEQHPKILVVDDTPQNIRLLEAILAPRGYFVFSAGSGIEALEQIAREKPDLILLDILMPGMDGYEVCRRLREEPLTCVLPIVMITASGDQEKIHAIEAGADDFISKPLNQPELLARVRSLLRVKEYYDTVQSQAEELALWNRSLETRVQQQVEELERLSRLRRFLSPHLAELIVASSDDFLKNHRREIAVVFCDLRGFTAFSETVEPEEVMHVLQEYHDVMGELVYRFDGTVGHFAGDGFMVIFNDPLPCEDPAGRAAEMALAMRDAMKHLAVNWAKRGHEIGFGVGITFGYATLGKIGFEGRFDYTAIGTVVTLAARLCAEARAGQILVSQRVHAAIEAYIEATPIGDLSLKGFSRPVAAFNVISLKTSA